MMAASAAAGEGAPLALVALILLAPRAGLEPATIRLTVEALMGSGVLAR
jgi:hypothetical protein